MFSFTEISNTLFGRGVRFTAEEYIFCLNIVLGEDELVAYALAFDTEGYKKVLGTEEEEEYLNSHKKDCDALLLQQSITQLKQEISDLYLSEVQNKALKLEDYTFTGGQIAQILQNLLKNRIEDLDTASTKDVISLIKMLTEQFGLGDSDGGFSKHFINIFPKFNALCISCNREFQVSEGLGCVCPHCGQQYQWVEEQQKFIPSPTRL